MDDSMKQKFVSNPRAYVFDLLVKSMSDAALVAACIDNKISPDFWTMSDDK